MPFEDQIRIAVEAARADAGGSVERIFGAFAQEVSRAAEARVLEASKQAEARIAELQRAADGMVADARRHADAQVAEVRRQAETQLVQLREGAHKQVEDLRSAAEAQAVELKRAVDEVRQRAQQQVDATRRAAQEELDEVRRLAAAEVDEARRRADADAEELLVSQLATAAADNDRRTRDAVESAVAGADAAALAAARRLAESVSALDGARTLGELLDYLAQCAGSEAERAAVFVRKGERLQGWRFVGFGPDAPVAKTIELDFDAAGIAGAAARDALEVEVNGEALVLPAFARTDAARHAHAIPLLVDGDVVAVLYADGAADSTAARWKPVLDVLARHVSRALEAMTVRQATGLSLPRPMARASQPADVGRRSGHIQ